MKSIGNGCVTFLFILVFLAVGTALTAYGWRILQNASVSENWPTTQGEITLSQIDEDHDSDGTTYSADVTYTYIANDQRYTSSTVSFGQYSSSNSSHAQSIVDKYSVGQLVIVFYDPTHPATAVLEPGRTLSSYALFIGGLLFLCVPGFLLLNSMRSFVPLD